MRHGRMYLAIVASGLVSGALLRSTDALGQIPGSIERSAPRAPATIANTIRLQIVVDPRTCPDDGSVKLARKVTSELLDAGGIDVEWREDIVAPGGREPAQGVVPVLLLPIRKASKPGVSGEVARNADTRGPMVIVYVAQIADLISEIRGRAGHGNRVVLGVGLGHVVGLTIAHEVGHILGLPHSASGVMRAEPDVSELKQLRASRLKFFPSEAARMQQTMTSVNQTAPGAR